MGKRQFPSNFLPIIQGEFLHRLSLYLAKGDLRGVFSNRHQQHWKCPCLLLLAFLIIVSQEQSPGLQQIFLRIIPVTVVWALIRVSGAMDNSVEDETIFSKSSQSSLPPLRLMFQERTTQSWVPDWQLIITTASFRFCSTLSWRAEPRWSTTTSTLLRPRCQNSVKTFTSKVPGITKCS